MYQFVQSVPRNTPGTESRNRYLLAWIEPMSVAVNFKSYEKALSVFRDGASVAFALGMLWWPPVRRDPTVTAHWL